MFGLKSLLFQVIVQSRPKYSQKTNRGIEL